MEEGGEGWVMIGETSQNINRKTEYKFEVWWDWRSFLFGLVIDPGLGVWLRVAFLGVGWTYRFDDNPY